MSPIMSPTDQRLIEAVAEMWVEAGGDAEGVTWMYNAIRDRVQELIDQRDKCSDDERE